MSFRTYVGKTEFNNIQFSFKLLHDVNFKMKEKILFYQEQVWDYILKEIDLYLKSLHVKQALLFVYKSEVLALLKYKVSQLFQNYNLFSCK